MGALANCPPPLSDESGLIGGGGSGGLLMRGENVVGVRGADCWRASEGGRNADRGCSESRWFPGLSMEVEDL